MILSALTVAIARYLSVEVKLTKYQLAHAQAKVLARSGIYLAMQRLQADVQDPEEGYDWLQDDWARAPNETSEDPTIWVVELPMAGQESLVLPPRIEIQIIDEERKLPLNRVQDEETNLWFTALSDLLQSPMRARRIVDYIDANTDPFGPDGLESSDEAVGLVYAAKNGPVVAHEELLDIPDMAEAFTQLRETTSHAELTGQLNINTVLPEVMVALGFRPATAQAVEACREQVIFESEATKLATAEQCVGLSDAEKTLLGEFGVTSQTFTVVSRGIVEQPPITVHLEALIQRSADGAQMPRILAWRAY